MLPSEGKAKAYSTWYSQAVSHPSTNQARPCLASEIRRDQACPGWYGRKRIQHSRAGVTQCQPENKHGEFQPSNRNELLPKSPPFHANGRRSTDPITNALVQRYGRLREWLWTPSWLHS